MTSGSLELLKLNRLIHDPGRLLILTFLYPVARLDYLELKKRMRFSTGNLSSHLAVLEKAGYVAIEKRFKGKYPQTICGMTKKGREALALYAEMLQTDYESNGKFGRDRVTRCAIFGATLSRNVFARNVASSIVRGLRIAPTATWT